MPLNELCLPLLRLAFPDCPVVLLRRHPLDVLVSAMAHDMTHGFNCGYRLEDAATHFALVDELLADCSRCRVGAPHELRYEIPVADQRDETDALMALSAWRSNLRSSLSPSAPRSPTPSYAQVQEPLNDRSIGRWRIMPSNSTPSARSWPERSRADGYAG